MQPFSLHSVLGTLRRLAGAEGENNLSDADLLERFRAQHEEAAFTLLVQRHGPMVLAVCRRVLGDLHEAEDAFQATFLVLVRRASAIRKQASLASWLYGVAYRVANKARSRAATCRAHERKAVTAMSSPEPSDALADPELRAALDEEMHQLPEKYRVPLVLCGLEGKTHEQAAQELRWPKSSVTARLARARDLLQRRLTSRGFAITAGVLTVLVAERTATAAVPATLTLATVRLALQTLTGTAAATAPAVALADHVLKGTTMNRLTATLALLLTVGLAAAGLALMTLSANPPVPRVPGGPDDPKRDAGTNALPEGALARLGSGRLRHGAPVSELAFAPDGNRLVSAGTGRLRVWDAATGGLEHQFRIGDFGLPIVAFSADGTLLTSDNKPNEHGCLLLDVLRGTKLRRTTLRPDPGALFTMAVSPGGRLFAIAEWDNVRLFDPATGKETLHLPVPDLMGGLHVALSPDGKAVAFGDNNSVIRVHDTTAGKRIAELKGEWNSLTRLTFSPDGQSLAGIIGGVPGSGDAVVVWDIAKGKERYRLPGMASSGTCVFTPDGKGLVVSELQKGRDLTLWNAADGKEIRRFVEGTWFNAAAFTPDGKVLAGATHEGAVVLWDVDSGKRLPQSSDGVRAVVQLQFTEGGKQLLGAAIDLITWDPATGRELRRLPDTRLIMGSAVSPSGKFLAVPGADFSEVLQVRDADTGKPVRRMPGDGFLPPQTIRFTPDERRVISASELSKEILVWDVASGEVVHRLTGLTGPATILAVSPDSRWLASCSFDPPPGKGDEALRLWDLRTGREAKQVPHQLLTIWDLAFSPDGSRLAAGGMQLHQSPPGRVQVWEVPTGKELLIIDTQTEMVKHVLFSPDGRTLATGSADANLRLWEVATGGERLRFRGHEGDIEALAFAPDGRTLAAASPDAPIFIWDVAGSSGSHQKQSAEDLRRCWDDLAGDAAVAFQAIRRLAAAPDQALPFLREQLRPVPAADPRHLRQLFDDLDSNEFAQRQMAAAALRELADRAAEALDQEARQTSSAEVRQALGTILDSIGTIMTGEPLRAVRAVEAIEAMGTPDAAGLLAELAGGTPSARLTREAGAACDRRRSPRP
jgi:RNA polymerase sigma factor (sigma-70 family)